MTFKIIQGLVANSPQLPAAQQARTADPRPPAVPQKVMVERAATGEAVMTTVYTTLRKVPAAESISSYQKAKDVASELAAKLREEHGLDAHQRLDERTGPGIVRQHLA